VSWAKRHNSTVKRKRTIRRYGNYVTDASEEGIRKLTRLAKKYTREWVRKKAYRTGALYRSISYRTYKGGRNQYYGIIRVGGDGAKHANLIQYGVGPHIIRSKDSNSQDALNVPGVGPREYVFHPGFKGRNFMTKGINKARRELKKVWRDANRSAYAKQSR